nr:hypothetical protein [Tanacetum cinerariifolium]
PLDQTGGPRDEEKEKSQSQQALQRKMRPRPLAKPSHQEFETGAANDQPIIEASQHPEWFQQQTIPPTPDRTLTPELLAGPTYELMKGSCKSLVELGFSLEEVYKATTDQLYWNIPEGQQYLRNLLKPLPLIPNSQGRRIIPFDHFINNDLDYLRGSASSRKYTTFITKTKAADYGHIKWIEDLFYEFAVNKDSARDVYSKRRVIAVTEHQIVEWSNFKHLAWITVSKATKRSSTSQSRIRTILISSARKLTPLTPIQEDSSIRIKTSRTAFMMNRIKVDTLTPELLDGPTFELIKGSCKSLVELEYFFEGIYKTTTDQLDWNNPKGQQYPHDLRKPLLWIPNSQGRRVIPFDHFINNDLAYLRGGALSQTYATSVTKIK